MESETRKQYIAYRMRRGYAMRSQRTGLVISVDSPWLVACPVVDQCLNPRFDLVKYKNPNSALSKTLAKIQNFCWEEKGEMYQLKGNYDYHFQMQCQLIAIRLAGVSFFWGQNNNWMYKSNPQWWENSFKTQTVYFKALLPKIGLPSHNKCGIREYPLKLLSHHCRNSLTWHCYTVPRILIKSHYIPCISTQIYATVYEFNACACGWIVTRS